MVGTLRFAHPTIRESSRHQQRHARYDQHDAGQLTRR
jgi:hypothetical protein